MTDNHIPITNWTAEDSPLASNVSYGPEGSIEEYWTKMSANYAELENGSLDDQFADDIFDVFDKDNDDNSVSSGEDENGNDDDEIGQTLLSFAQGMMQDDDDDEEGDQNYSDDDDGYDHQSGVDYEADNEEPIGGMLLSDMHPKHTPLQNSELGLPISQSSKNLQPHRLSDSEMKQLAASYKVERSENDDGCSGEEEEDDDDDDEQVCAAGLLMGSEDDDEEDLDAPQVHHSNKHVHQETHQPRAQQKGHHRTIRAHLHKQPVAPQPSHPFLRQQSKRDKKGDHVKSKKEIERKHKMLLLKMVEKKRQEEEQLVLAVKKAEAKRKKFKEVLLEKALRSKQLKAEEEERERELQLEKEAILVEKMSKASDASRRSKPLTKRPVAKVEQERMESVSQQEEDEAALQAEENEARAKMEEAIRARKRFVKNQKAILAALRAKKEEEALRKAQQEEEEQRLRELQKKRNEKFLRQREKKKLEQEEVDVNVEATAGVGSALSAVRATRSQDGNNSQTSLKARPVNRSVSATYMDSLDNSENDSLGKDKPPRRRLKKVKEVKEIILPSNRKNRENMENDKEDEEVEDPAIKEKRREEARLRQEKVSQHLAILAEQRKEASEAARRKEERAKLRAELLRQRAQMEYSERKQMASEDKFVNGDIKVLKPKMGAVAPVEEKKPKKKITTEMAEAMVDRMQMKKIKALNQAEGKDTSDENAGDVSSLLPPARDFLDWKKKNGVPPTGARVFCMTGWYPCVKDALLQRGWVFNPDSSSSHFDLKWTLRSSDVTKGSLQPWQLTNHYLKNVALTTKIGLMKSLQQLNWIADVSSDDIFPRGYDLSSPLEIQEYIDDYRHEHVVNLLKKLYLRVTGLESPVVSDVPLPSPRLETSNDNDVEKSTTYVPVSMQEPAIPPPPKEVVPNLDEFMVNKAVFNACVNVLSRFLIPYFSENAVDVDITVFSRKITAVEWELVQNYDMYSPATLPDESKEPVDDFLREKEREAEMNIAHALPTLEKKKALSDIKHRARKEQYRQDKERERASDALEKMMPLGADGLQRVHTLLSQCKMVSHKQYGLNGNASGAKNMWIVKPAAKSRGRGIMAFNDLEKLLTHVELGKSGKTVLTSSQWIVQKYMENPLIIANRKFDFRQWVLVVSWNPLTIYFYDEFYCRFSSEDYDTSDEAMSNAFVHLVNNSIGKNNEKFHKPLIADNGEEIRGFMWTDDDFRKYVAYKTRSDETIEKIKNRMKDIAIWSLMCGADSIEHRKNSWELYGFDYMMDDTWTPWLIEINSSPACDYSTGVTERYVKKALVEVLKVTLDVRDWEKLPKGSRPPKPDTGGWECIYTGPNLEINTSLGTDMYVQGEPMKVPRKRPAVQRQHIFPPREVVQAEDEEEDIPTAKIPSGKQTKVHSSSPRSSSDRKISHTNTPPGGSTKEVVMIPKISPSQTHSFGTVVSPIDSSVENKKNASSRAPPISGIADMVEQRNTTSLQTKSSPIEFDDSDDDFSAENIEYNNNGSHQIEVSALEKLDNAQLTAQVREIVAVPLAVNKLEFPMADIVNDNVKSSSQSGKSGGVLPGRKVGAGSARSKPSHLEGQASAAPIPIKTFDPFA